MKSWNSTLRPFIFVTGLMVMFVMMGLILQILRRPGTIVGNTARIDTLAEEFREFSIETRENFAEIRRTIEKLDE